MLEQEKDSKAEEKARIKQQLAAVNTDRDLPPKEQKAKPSDSIFQAIEKGDLEIIKRHYSAGAELQKRNADGLTTLQFAILHQQAKVVTYLLTQDLHEQLNLLETPVQLSPEGQEKYKRYRIGSSTLTLAIAVGNTDIFESIIAIRSGGGRILRIPPNPLKFAVEHGNNEDIIANLLIMDERLGLGLFDTNPSLHQNSRDYQLASILHLAVVRGNPHIVQCVISNMTPAQIRKYILPEISIVKSLRPPPPNLPKTRSLLIETVDKLAPTDQVQLFRTVVRAGDVKAVKQWPTKTPPKIEDPQLNPLYDAINGIEKQLKVSLQPGNFANDEAQQFAMKSIDQYIETIKVLLEINPEWAKVKVNKSGQPLQPPIEKLLAIYFQYTAQADISSQRYLKKYTKEASRQYPKHITEITSWDASCFRVAVKKATQHVAQQVIDLKAKLSNAIKIMEDPLKPLTINTISGKAKEAKVPARSQYSEINYLAENLRLTSSTKVINSLLKSSFSTFAPAPLIKAMRSAIPNLEPAVQYTKNSDIPLLAAAQQRDSKNVQQLLDKKADVTIKHGGANALHYAVYGMQDIIDDFLKDKELKDPSTIKSVIESSRKCLDTITLLMKKHPDLAKDRDSTGATPSELVLDTFLKFTVNLQSIEGREEQHPINKLYDDLETALLHNLRAIEAVKPTLSNSEIYKKVGSSGAEAWGGVANQVVEAIKLSPLQHAVSSAVKNYYYFPFQEEIRASLENTKKQDLTGKDPEESSDEDEPYTHQSRK